MKLIAILSDQLPEIADSVKECVNQGEWLLFRGPSEGPEDRDGLFLKIGQDLFELDDVGHVVAERVHARQAPTIDTVYYFSDLPRPHSLSNVRYSSVVH